MKKRFSKVPRVSVEGKFPETYSQRIKDFYCIIKHYPYSSMKDKYKFELYATGKGLLDHGRMPSLIATVDYLNFVLDNLESKATRS